MSQQELLKKVVQALNANKIDYMITGSVASSFYGEPRSTHDIDVVVSINKAEVEGLAASFPIEEFYLDKDEFAEAIENRRMVNVIDINEGDKIDFWVLSDEAFSRECFSRKAEEDFMGIKVKFPTPEDVIVSKLKWAKESGGSEKQLQDVKGVYEVYRDKLALPYIERWIKQLALKDLWELVINRK
ncbi:MAG: hypothetical protein Q8O90_11865 [Elusimicrobiota bacterium]|nr:hypothetical protein [Elusimicrobiota bacterium]